MTSHSVILFDLDGTLTDPKPGITRSVQYALARCKIIEPDLDALTPFIGPPLSESFQAYYQMDEMQARQAVSFYREYFAETGLYENAVYPGIPALLKKLINADKHLIVATSKPTIFAEKILVHFQLDQFFERILGSNLDDTRSAKTEIIACVGCVWVFFSKDKFIMVGDRKHDIIGAQNNHIDSIGVSYGYGTLNELEGAAPTYIVETVERLADLLTS